MTNTHLQHEKMTDRDRLNLAYGLLFGATNAAKWIEDGNVRFSLIEKNILKEVLDILYLGDTNASNTDTK